VEHGYKSLQVVYYGRDDLLPVIEQTKCAMDVMKMVNRKLEGFNCEEWTLAKYNIMKALLEEKFLHFEDFKNAILESTGTIVEATNHAYWASGLPGIRATKDTPIDQWPGQNKLGELMMEMRDSYKASTQPSEGLSTQEEQLASTTQSLEWKNAQEDQLASKAVASASNASAAEPIADSKVPQTEAVHTTTQDDQDSESLKDLMSQDEQEEVPIKNGLSELLSTDSDNDSGVTLVLSDSILNGATLPDNVILAA
jgi:ribA/ribD-fused uncharacterized protein